MKLFAAFRKHPLQRARRARRPSRPPVAEPVRDEDDGTPAACGWFDSSYLLRSGLHITEYASVDSVVNELPLGWYLAWQVAAQRPAFAAAASTAR